MDNEQGLYIVLMVSLMYDLATFYCIWLLFQMLTVFQIMIVLHSDRNCENYVDTLIM